MNETIQSLIDLTVISDQFIFVLKNSAFQRNSVHRVVKMFYDILFYYSLINALFKEGERSFC